jgi:prepilin-type N-terminal cleavage/methylation domain-containing protein
MKINNNKLTGFTLIELLVVVAIIGILASVVIVNLNSARAKGQDSAIKQQLAQLRSSGELYYDTTVDTVQVM